MRKQHTINWYILGARCTDQRCR